MSSVVGTFCHINNFILSKLEIVSFQTQAHPLNHRPNIFYVALLFLL